MPTMKVKKLDPNAKTPTKGTQDSAGYDFYATKDGVIHPGEREMVNTGLAVAIPKGYWGLARTRSGNATKHGVDICSSCIIDSDYRGELMFPLINHDMTRPFKYSAGDRIGQMVIVPQPEINIEEVEELDETQRGIGGFGSTGLR